ncbi:putative indole-3-pyruvate monooxygenase YUCCA3 [Hypsizygus marmoreus]|uniref:Indole-3-pyruvate monooxygenase YUCCA3 n=1 Tax=Hypsizygus marmoreus TaxID=39966 RepID=A0A369JHC4_HYPMA|nr:putative indole-3-pyruvate monooxygenase YUCCA3 [Hypsizygus marmoreus]
MGSGRTRGSEREVAARLKALGVPALVVEKNGRVDDKWRNRYEALCLHDPVWYDHMPYLPFPPTWPVYTPALKLAKWLEHYAEALELNVWTSSTVVSAKQDPATSNGTSLSAAATGPSAHSQDGNNDVFKGQMIHSYWHKSARDHLGKKVEVHVPLLSRAAHDIAVDHYENGVGVYSENAVPTAIADRLNTSFPHHMSIELVQRTTKIIAELDKPILNSLRARGFKLNDGIMGIGFGLLAWDHAGGYYLADGDGGVVQKSVLLVSTTAPASSSSTQPLSRPLECTPDIMSRPSISFDSKQDVTGAVKFSHHHASEGQDSLPH